MKGPSNPTSVGRPGLPEAKRRAVEALVRQGLTPTQIKEATNVGLTKIYEIRRLVNEKAPGAATPEA